MIPLIITEHAIDINLNAREQLLLNNEAGATEPRLQLCTDTRIDVGLWWLKRPLWLCVFDEEILLFAVGRRRYSERVPVADCGDSHYNPTSGELVILPTDALRFSRLKMPSSQAMKVLNILKQNSTPNTTAP